MQNPAAFELKEVNTVMRNISERLAACIVVLALLGLAGCGKTESNSKTASKTGSVSSNNTKDPHMPGLGFTSEPLGEKIEGNEVTQYLLRNDHGMTVSIIDYGAIVTSVQTPDRDGKVGEVTLGFKKFSEYGRPGPYFGAICGRFANRIAGGKFTIDGKEYQLATNNGPNHLHGGVLGFNRKLWRAETPQKTGDAVSLKLNYISEDGEEGYPGTLDTTVTYTLTNSNELKIEYVAKTDKPTHVNLTNHCYWNLAGEGTILDHQLTLFCDQFLPVDDTLIPTGKRQDVKSTPWDFTTAHKIGERILDKALGPEGKTGRGYDHCYVVRDSDRDKASGMALVARVHDPKSGRVMEVLTDQPGVQFYSGNFLDDNVGPVMHVRPKLLRYCLILSFACYGCGSSAKSKTVKSKSKTTTVKKQQPPKTAPLLAEVPKAEAVNTQYITDDFVAAAVLHPARFLNHQTTKDMLALVDKHAEMPATDPGHPRQMLLNFEAQTGINPRNLEQVVVLIDRRITDNPIALLMPTGAAHGSHKKAVAPKEDGSHSESLPRKNAKPGKKSSNIESDEANKPAPESPECNPVVAAQPAGRHHAHAPAADGPPIPAFILRFKTPFNKQRVLEKWVSYAVKEKPRAGIDLDDDRADAPASKPKVIKPSPVQFGEHTYYHIEHLGAYCFVDDKTILAGPVPHLKKMLTAKNVDTPLTRRLQAISAKNDLIVTAELAALKGIKALAPLLQQGLGRLRMLPAAGQVLGSAAQLQSLTITASATGGPLATISLEMDTEETAQKLSTLIDEQTLNGARFEWSGGRDRIPNAIDPAAQLVDRTFAGSQVENEGVYVNMIVRRPSGFDTLAKLLDPVVIREKSLAASRIWSNNLKQIGIAFHNYEASHSAIPAAGSSGIIDGETGQPKHSGLSWRVHLLPFLEQTPLYRQFKLDEPWDSPHNKKLISQMPDIFKTPGVEETGTTSIHVFVGTGTPFGGRNGLRFDSATDGLSNVMMAVVAGADKAEIWTKPGGLAFNPKSDPMLLLGKLKGDRFLALLMDGSVHQVARTIDRNVLKHFIQHADGAPTPPLP
eukprot:g26616.t1